MTTMTRDQLLEENTWLRRENSRCHEVEHRYSKILDSSRDFVYIHDFDGNFLWGNATILNKLGYTHEEFTRS